MIESGCNMELNKSVIFITGTAGIVGANFGSK